MSDLVAKSADALPLTSRNFYENAVFKTFLSIIWGAIALIFLGMCCTSGGISSANKYFNDADLTDDYQKITADRQVGFGFASFFFFCAFAIMVGAAFHISPLVNGSGKEATTLRRPLDLER